MLIQKAYKYRLYPTDQQAQRLRQLCGCARFIWNYALNETLSIHDAGGKIPSAFDLNKRLTGWKKLPELAFLAEGYTDNLQQKLKDLRSAWDRCFDKSLTAEKPVFKKKTKGCDSIRFVNFSKYCGLDYGRVKLPSGLGWVKFRQSRKIEGVIKNCTFSQHAGHWYVSFQVELAVTDPIHASTSAIGLDASITKLATLSDGTVFEPVNSFKKIRISWLAYSAVWPGWLNSPPTGKSRKRRFPVSTLISQTSAAITFIKPRRRSAKTTR